MRSRGADVINNYLYVDVVVNYFSFVSTSSTDLVISKNKRKT